MNYSTQVLEFLAAHSKYFGWRDQNSLLMVRAAIKSAHKYVTPPPRAIKANITEHAAKFIKATHPELLFEYDVPDSIDSSPFARNTVKSSKRIALVIDMDNSQSELVNYIKLGSKHDFSIPGSLAIISLSFLDNDKMWNPSCGAAIWHPSMVVGEGMVLDGARANLSYKAVTILPDILASVVRRDKMDANEIDLFVRNDVHEELAHALRMLALINCRNIKPQVLVREEPTKLNDKRERAGKPNFFAYHTLPIFLAAEAPKAEVNPESFKKIWRMTGVAETEVTGHFKVRKSGVWWWNFHLRGDKKFGKVINSHEVK